MNLFKVNLGLFFAFFALNSHAEVSSLWPTPGVNSPVLQGLENVNCSVFVAVATIPSDFEMDRLWLSKAYTAKSCNEVLGKTFEEAIAAEKQSIQYMETYHATNGFNGEREDILKSHPDLLERLRAHGYGIYKKIEKKVQTAHDMGEERQTDELTQ